MKSKKLRQNNLKILYYLIIGSSLYGCDVKGRNFKKQSGVHCLIDTAIFNSAFSICKEKDSNNVTVNYRQNKQTIPWPSAMNTSKNVNSILLLGDTSLKGISSIFYDSVYLFSLNDTDINEGLLYGIRFNSKATIDILKDVDKSYKYLLCRYGQFILDTSQKSILIANQNINEADSTDDFTFSVYSFREKTFKYINTIKGNTHYVYTKEQMLNLLSNYR